MFRKYFFKPFIHLFYRPLVLKYISKKRKYSFKNINLIIRKGVFHPGLFFSTKFLIEFLEKENLEGKRLLELGSGSGLISIFSERKKAIVTASDISKTAVENTEENAIRNHSVINVIQSDLFDEMKNLFFDFIIINPPYYPKNPGSESDFAWFCGDDYSYFRKLFSELNFHISDNSKVIMCWSEDSDIKPVIQIADSFNFRMIELKRKQIWFENNFIYQIIKTEK